MNIKWKQKLTSRKFWVSLTGFVSALCVACNVDPGTAEQITALIISGASLITYVLAESIVDAKRG